jgi:hypothetical protein
MERRWFDRIIADYLRHVGIWMRFYISLLMTRETLHKFCDRSLIA